MNTEVFGIIFNIQKFSVHDGPGIRTTVFMKGCPLTCRWCSNAESISPQPEPGIIVERCTGCGDCVSICPENALGINSRKVVFDRSACNACGECLKSCSEEAITIYGKKVTPNEVLKEVLKDRSFYTGSNGGVTVSGGEPLQQPEFVEELFRKCREEGIHTCLDTCGYAPGKVLRQILQYTDYVLYDLKHMDVDRHKEFTGVDNELITDNARLAAKSDSVVLFRIPLIDRVNSDEDNIRKTVEFIKSLGEKNKVELLPYHRLGIGKYKILGRDYPGREFETPDEGTLKTLADIFIDNGIQCDIGR
ncbi:MAG: glycyl-radical enzyme activating protein [Dehalococcoidales bacterium]|nr:MAG: glycyl-radical enzyme activating protein [Dehalococcoidales bacterium]